MDLKKYIRSIPDYPKKGILFRDITTLIKDEKGFKESIDQKIEDLDVSQDVEALVDGEELSEDFKTKAATIFESAIKSKVRSELEKIQEENDKQMEELAETSMTSMVEKVDDYLNYVVEQWMSENELAIERGLKGEIAEDFISGLKGLFEDHYIDVPDEKYDILEANLTKIEELEDKLNKQMEVLLIQQLILCMIMRILIHMKK